MGFVTFFTPSENGAKKQSGGGQIDTSDMKNNLRELKDFADEEIKIVESYLEKFNSLSQKVNEIQATHLNAVKRMKSTIDN